MDEVLKIKCPWCSAVLQVKNQPGIASKMVSCPICKTKQPFTAFKMVNDAPKKPDVPDYTVYPGSEEFNAPKMGNSQENEVIGILRYGNKVFNLKEGRNIIGRMATSSKADIMVPTDEKHMSREHIVVDVKKVAGKGFVHCVELYKEQVNKTFVGDEELHFGDCLILKDGDVIKLPGAQLVFRIPDPDATMVG